MRRGKAFMDLVTAPPLRPWSYGRYMRPSSVFDVLSLVVAASFGISNLAAFAAEESKADSKLAETAQAEPAAAETKVSVPTEQQMKVLASCLGCHDLSADRKTIFGPPLFGTWGAKPVTVGVPFAKWDKPALERWLKDPTKIVPQTKMTFKVANSKKRQDIIKALEGLR